MIPFLKSFCLIICFILCFSGPLSAVEHPKEDLATVGLTTKLGTKVDLGLRFTSGTGKEGTLTDFIRSGKPIILTPVYYGCPRLCGFVLQNFTQLINDIPLRLGDDYQVLTVSFDSTEDTAIATTKADKYQGLYRDTDAAKQGWSFLIGTEENIAPLMSQIGFHYKSDKGEFAHSAAIMILTPQGEISQYFTDINFSPWDVKLALIEASEGKIGSAIDHFLLFCYRFDPTKGKYTLAAWNFARLGVFLCALGSAYVVLRYSRRKRIV